MGVLLDDIKQHQQQKHQTITIWCFLCVIAHTLFDSPPWGRLAHLSSKNKNPAKTAGIGPQTDICTLIKNQNWLYFTRLL